MASLDTPTGEAVTIGVARLGKVGPVCHGLASELVLLGGQVHVDICQLGNQ